MDYKLMLYKSREEAPLGTLDTLDEVREFIVSHLEHVGFKSYYQRWYQKNPIICDFGSHHTFFHVYEVE